MIYQGKYGSMCFYYLGMLISGFPLSDIHTEENYLYQGDHLIMETKGIPIMNQITAYRSFCNLIYRKKHNKERITRREHILFISSLCALLRLNVIQNDDMNGYLICKRK